MENNEEKTAQKQVHQPKPADELRKNGSTVLSSKTREELITLSDSVAASIKDRKVCIGIIGYNYKDNVYSVQLNIIN